MRVIDLTLTLRDGMRGVAFEQKYTTADKGWNAKTLHLYSHCGTHLDAPNHYDVHETGVDALPLQRLMGTAWVVDAWDVPPKTPLTLTHLGDICEQFKAGESLLIKTGWSRFVDEPLYREGLPPLSDELAQWCATAGVNMLGVEPPAVADPFDIPQMQKIHHILLEAGIIIIEGLTNLDQLQSRRVQFIALPLKIENGDGSPVRALSIESENDKTV